MTWRSTHYPDSGITDWPQATITEANTYLLTRGRSTWPDYSIPARTAALQRAWDYLCSLTDWKDYVFETELPVDIKNAQIVGAYAEITSPGILQPTLTSDNYLKKKNIAGVIVKEYSGTAPVASIREMDALLSRYRNTYSGSCRELVRG